MILGRITELLLILLKTYFGRPMTNLDGGLFNIELAFSPRFPVETPRAKFLTPFYHYRVTSKFSTGMSRFITNTLQRKEFLVTLQ